MHVYTGICIAYINTYRHIPHQVDGKLHCFLLEIWKEGFLFFQYGLEEVPGQAGLDKLVACGELIKEGSGKEGDIKAGPTGKAEVILQLQLEEELLNR